MALVHNIIPKTITNRARRGPFRKRKKTHAKGWAWGATVQKTRLRNHLPRFGSPQETEKIVR